MTTHEHYIMETNIRDEFDIYFTLNEKLRLLNRELKRTKKKIIVNQFIQNHFINDASYGGDYFWVDNDYVNEFNDKLCSYMLHHESVKLTINNIIKEINDTRYRVDNDDHQTPVEEEEEEENDETHHEDDEEFLREVESTPDIDFIETYNCEYDGEYYINNEADERYNGGVGGVGGDEFDEDEEVEVDDEFEEEVEVDDEFDDEEEDDEFEEEEEDEINIDDEFEEEEEEEVEVDDEFEEDEEEEEEDEGFDDNGEEVNNGEEVTGVRVNIPISSIGKTPVDNNHMVPIFPVFLLNKIIGFFSGGK